MRYRAIASDYDGTMAHDGVVSESTREALYRLKVSGRKLILVTGRQLNELCEAFPAYEMFDRIVAENGGVLFDPKTHTEKALASAPSPNFTNELTKRGVQSLAVGKVIVATWHPYEETVLQTIRDMGLESQIIFNKGAVMVLPPGVNKASGLAAALRSLSLSAHNVVGVGDAENDHAFLQLCEAAVAVGNSLDSLKQNCDWVTKGKNGAGVEELIERLLQNDLSELQSSLSRYNISLGNREDNSEVELPPYGTSVLVAGTSGGGKSTLTNSIIERLGLKGYQYCIIDPEGDYSELDNCTILGDAKHSPSTHEVLTALSQPDSNCVVNLLGVQPSERPSYFEHLLAELLKLQSDTGRPHWLILDESHHILPVERADRLCELTNQFGARLLVTVNPEHVAAPTLADIDLILAIGQEPRQTISNFSRLVGEAMPEIPDVKLDRGESIAWWRDRQQAFWFRSHRPSLPQKRHTRKYAEGDMRENSFIFRGPEGKLNLRAQNLLVFLQMGDGVDDSTWSHHLHRGDFERWFREVVKDSSLADRIREIAQDKNISGADSRKILRRAIEATYSAPA